jgi:hypothetical protein
MALNSSSTFAQIQAQYMDNLPPLVSAGQAALFIEACSALLLKMPEQSGAPEQQIRFRMDLIDRQRSEARAWLDTNGPVAGSSAAGTAVSRVARLDFTGGRD